MREPATKPDKKALKRKALGELMKRLRKRMRNKAEGATKTMDMEKY